jgi:hypothetical protein
MDKVVLMRQTGQTSKQIQDAPVDSVFVWVINDVRYPEQLARTLGRTDLKIVGRSWITSERWRGLRLSGVVVDHSIRPSIDELEALCAIRSRICYGQGECDER